MTKPRGQTMTEQTILEPTTDIVLVGATKPVTPKRNGVVIHRDIEQGSEAWIEIRRGILTASEMKLIITPTLQVTNNNDVRTHLYELLAQRVTKHVEPHYQSYDMERGTFEEEHARTKYAAYFAPVEEVGFITNDKLGFIIGCSPDGLVGDDGQIEAKSRLQKLQMKVLIECAAVGTIPAENLIQVQSALFVSERKWLDYISYSGGMKMPVIRCYPDPAIHEAIGNACISFENKLADRLAIYEDLIASDARLVDTERLIML